MLNKKTVTILALFALALFAGVALAASIPLATFETGESWWLLGNLQYDTTHVMEGDRSLKMTMQPAQIEFAELVVSYDMSVDGKVVVNFYGETGPGSAHYLSLRLYFETSAGNAFTTRWVGLEKLPQNLWLTLERDKAAFETVGAPDWSDINKIRLVFRNPHPGPLHNDGYIWVDSILLVSPDTEPGVFPFESYLPMILK